MYNINDFKKGLKVLIDNEPYTIIDFQHVNPGKGNRFTRTKLKHLVTGTNLDRTFKQGDRFGDPDIEYRDMSFLYKDDNGFHFMDTENYEQLCLSSDIVGSLKNFLTEELQVKLCFFNEKAVALEIPGSVLLKVTQTDPGFKGNTVSNTTKPATLETGFVVQVPLHINEDDMLKINTETGEYVERAST